MKYDTREWLNFKSKKTSFFMKKFILPFVKTHYIHDDKFQLAYKKFRGIIYIVDENFEQETL